MAKRIIHLAVKVGDLINKDPETRDLLRLYFLPDYNVSLAEVIIPGGRHNMQHDCACIHRMHVCNLLVGL
jgi:starch phosphorylase